MIIRLFFSFLILLSFAGVCRAEGIIPVICATPKYKGCKNISEIYEYNWQDYPYNSINLYNKKSNPPLKVYAITSDSVYEYNWQDYPYNSINLYNKENKPPVKVYAINSK